MTKDKFGMSVRFFLVVVAHYLCSLSQHSLRQQATMS
jgi:hypothetical protein